MIILNGHIRVVVNGRQVLDGFDEFMCAHWFSMDKVLLDEFILLLCEFINFDIETFWTWEGIIYGGLISSG